MKIEQQAGGPADSEDLYTGLERQLTVDTSNWNLRLHDGVTQGGFTLLSRNNADVRYQARSLELDGFLEFEPQNRGIVIRRGPSDYKLRTLEVYDTQLRIERGNGYAGNPKLGLAAIISTPHTFSATVTFTGDLEADGGIQGDLTGNVTGNLTGNVTGNVTGNLTGNANGNHTGTFTGSVDVSGDDDSIAFSDGQIPLEALDDILGFTRTNGFPQGGIIMWSGDSEDIPNGWLLCNGTFGTPDLRERFICGAGATGYSTEAHDSGGSATHSHATATQAAGSHSHTITVANHTLTVDEIPSHKHANGVTDNTEDSEVMQYGTTPADTPDSIDNNPDAGTYQGWTSNVGGGTGHAHDASSAAAGSHVHTMDNPTTSSLPPYYALCFIMRSGD